MSFNAVVGSQLARNKVSNVVTYVSPVSYGLVLDVNSIWESIENMKSIVVLRHTLDIGNMLSNKLRLFHKLEKKYAKVQIDIEKNRKSWRKIELRGPRAYSAYLELMKLLVR